MKKLYQFVISRAARAAARSGILTARMTDARITKGLEQWVKDGKYASTDLELGDVADEIGVSRAALQCYFSNVIGVRFSSWRKALRIEKAKAILLERPDLPVSTVGAMVGFPDKSNFRARFREIEDCSPREWRERNL